MKKNKNTAGNIVYKLWLGLSSLGKSCGFPKASFSLERFVPRHATAHIQNRYRQGYDDNPTINNHIKYER